MTAPSASADAGVRSRRDLVADAVPWLALGGIVVLAAVLRFAALGAQSLWFDEAATWEVIRLPFGEMLSALPDRESNPPLFYVLEWLVTRALGDSEFALRLLSAVAGTATVPIAYAIGRRLGGLRAGLATAALVAVNPLLVWFSQEARSYQLVVLLSAAGLLLFLRSLEDDRPRLLAWWALLSALALCSHYFAVFVIVPQALWLLRAHPRRRAAVAACGALAAAGAALLPLLLSQSDNPYDIAHDSLAVRLLQLPKQFLLGYRGPLGLVTGLLGALLVAVALWLLLSRADRAARLRTAPVAAVALIGLLLPMLAALAGADYVNARNLLPALVPLAAVLGVGFAPAAGPRWLGPGAVGLLCALSTAIVVSVATDAEYQRSDWRGLAEALGDSDDTRAIVASPANGIAPLRYYLPGLYEMPQEGVPLREIDIVAVAASGAPGEQPRLPQQYGDSFPGTQFGRPRETRTDTYMILRYRQPAEQVVRPEVAANVRLSWEPPSVSVLSGGR